MNFNDDQERRVIDLRKSATRRTVSINEETYKKMDWSRIEAENQLAKAGMLVNAGLPVIKSENSSLPAWNLRRYAFLVNNEIPDTVNPKLWVQGNLNLNVGLFKVTDNIYQVRGFDLANMTLIRGNTGWIVIDCLGSKETAQAALKLAADYFGRIPVSAVIITHSHEDHYGGILGVVEEFVGDQVKIYAPKNFIHAALEENVNVGIAMSRRGIYMYGVELLRDAKGQIDNGIGKGQSIGTVTFTKNIEEITEQHEEKVIDGVAMEFLLALDTEAPSEMLIYIPGEKSLCIAELCNATLHNLLTPRGAKIRDPIAWTKGIQNAIDLWGGSLTSVFGVHNWP